MLAPLAPEVVEQLLADALRAKPGHTRSLADLVLDKTAGNPFFAIQFLLALAEEALLVFDPGTASWNWDLPRIRGKGFTDNVVDLMTAKLGRLPEATQKALGHLACLGNRAAACTLTLVHGGTAEALHEALWEAVRAGLLLRSDGEYAFLHDRIQEAAYALIPAAERAETHLGIGRLLATQTTSEALEEHVFDIVNQFDRGAALIATQEERDHVASLNLMAGRRAKAATAFGSAMQYFTAGSLLLDEDAWQRCHQLAFELELDRAECAYLVGEMPAAQERLSALSDRARTIAESAAVTCVRLNLYTILNQSEKGIEVALDYLRRVDDQWPVRATAEHVRQDYEQLQGLLGSRPVEALLDLPLITDPDRRGTMDVLTRLASLSLFNDADLFRFVIGRMAILSLRHGNSDGSCLAYAWLGGIISTYFGDCPTAYRFGRLGLDLVEQRGLKRFSAGVYLVFGAHVAHWTQPLAMGRRFLRRAFDASEAAGDRIFAGYSYLDLITNLIASGDPLPEIERQAEEAIELVHKRQFRIPEEVIRAQLGLVRMLRGKTLEFDLLPDASGIEDGFAAHLASASELANPWLRKLQACVFAGDPRRCQRGGGQGGSAAVARPDTV